MAASSDSRWRAPTFVALVTAGVFARALPYPLQRSWDDARFILDNPVVRAPSWDAFRTIWTTPLLEAYHPLHLLSYWLDAPWTGANAWVLHAVSLLLWIAAASALLSALLRLGLSQWAAAIATLACVLHPVQVEAVSWAAGRKDVLALLFAALALNAHLRSGSWLDRRAWLARVLYGAGMLAKTTVLPLPAVLFAADVLVRRQTWRRALLAQLPSLALGAGMSALVLGIWQDNEMLRLESHAGVLTRVVATFGHQLGTALWPATNAPMYSTSALADPPLGAWFMLAAFAILLALLLVAARRGEQRAALAAFGLAAFAILLAPVSNLVPMYFPFQDRYLSLPLVGLAITLGASWDALPRAAVRALQPALVCALALRCVQYQGEWQSELRLWGHGASVQPDAYYAFMKLGEVRRSAGELDGSIAAYRELLRIDPARKTGYAALVLSVALRDERVHHLQPSLAQEYASRVYVQLDDPDQLRDLAAHMLATGHVRALEVPLARSLALQPAPDRVLEHAAETQFKAGNASVGLFYLHRMRAPSARPDLRAIEERAEHALAASPRVVD